MNHTSPVRETFSRLWTAVHGYHFGYRWIDDPWVWALDFSVIGGFGELSATERAAAKGIGFTSSMVRAIRGGQKTQTRRVIRESVGVSAFWRHAGYVPAAREPSLRSWAFTCRDTGEPVGEGAPLFACPFGGVGSPLYVREGIRRLGQTGYSEYVADGADTGADAWPWKTRLLPGRFMPKGLARTWLRLVDVRVEKLCEISEADARAEGALAWKEEADGEEG